MKNKKSFYYLMHRTSMLFVVLCMFTLMFHPVIGKAELGEGLKQRIIQKLIERRRAKKTDDAEKAPTSEQGFYVSGKGQRTTQSINKREYIVYTPPRLRARGSIPLLVVLHGGFGSAKQIEKYIGLEPYADRSGFIIAYLHGTKVARLLPSSMEGWNGGECCGLPQDNNVDDVGFISNVVHEIVQRYGVDPAQVYGTGHSNGAIMTYRMLCETDVYRAGVPYSGALEMAVDTCPKARGKRILAIHGANDLNVPVQGGHSPTGINKETDYRSQAYTQGVFLRSGADIQMLILAGAEHKPETLNAALLATEGVTLPQKIVMFLGLDR